MKNKVFLHCVGHSTFWLKPKNVWKFHFLLTMKLLNQNSEAFFFYMITLNKMWKLAVNVPFHAEFCWYTKVLLNRMAPGILKTGIGLQRRLSTHDQFVPVQSTTSKTETWLSLAKHSRGVLDLTCSSRRVKYILHG